MSDWQNVIDTAELDVQAKACPPAAAQPRDAVPGTRPATAQDQGSNAAARTPASERGGSGARTPKSPRVQAEGGLGAPRLRDDFGEVGAAREAPTPPVTDAERDARSRGGAVARGDFMAGEDGHLGGVTLVETPNGVLLTAQIAGLEPGAHGFHIHETGRCEGPDFASAGGHWAPEGKPHGFATEEGPHAGDMPNIFASSDGLATVHVFLDGVTLTGARPMLDEDGAAVIVHERDDTYLSEARSGDRVACAALTAPG